MTPVSCYTSCMSNRKSFLTAAALIASLSLSLILIWQGLDTDKKNPIIKVPDPDVLGNQSEMLIPEGSESAVQTKFLVTKVVDGDTFEIEVGGEKFSVRLIGIDTPETVDPRRPVGCFGKSASEETKRLIEGRQVILTKDISETDKYDRLLRYAFLPLSDGQNLFINDYLVRQGFANSYDYPPDVKYSSRFALAEKEARENLRGLWSECK